MDSTRRILAKFLKLIESLGLQTLIDLEPDYRLGSDDQVLVVLEDDLTYFKRKIKLKITCGFCCVIFDQVHIPLWCLRLVYSTTYIKAIFFICLDYRDTLFDHA